MAWRSRPKCWRACRRYMRFRKRPPWPGSGRSKPWLRRPLKAATIHDLSHEERKTPMSVTFQLARRFLTEVDPRLVWKFAVNFGIKGGLSVERFKRRLRKGIHFP